jgi:predicted Holliday junction resolvase-like endonuclease
MLQIPSPRSLSTKRLRNIKTSPESRTIKEREQREAREEGREREREEKKREREREKEREVKRDTIRTSGRGGVEGGGKSGESLVSLVGGEGRV